MDSSRALMFTDARGQVVFVDSNFIKMTGRSSSAAVVGTPMHELLGIEREAALGLLREISQTGQVDRKPIELHDASGSPVEVICTGIATYDDRKFFIGADLAMLRVSVSAPVAPTVTQPNVVEPEAVDEPALVAEVEEDQLDPAYAARLRVYFLEHMRSLRELMAKVGGNRLRLNFNNIVNETAARNEWPIVIEGEVFFVEVNRHHLEAYRGMLARVISYAVNMIGANLVIREFERVNQQLDAGTVETGQSLELSALFVDPK